MMFLELLRRNTHFWGTISTYPNCYEKRKHFPKSPMQLLNVEIANYYIIPSSLYKII